MKKVMMLISTVVCVSLLAITHEEAYQISSYLMECYTTSDEWSDDLDSLEESAEEEIVVQFPSADSLFAFQFPTNSIAANYTPDELKQIFDLFLLQFAATNRIGLSRQYESVGSYALIFCGAMCYTNGLCATTGILSRIEAPCRDDAYTAFEKIVQPEEGMSDYVYAILTNHVWYSELDRGRLFAGYARKIKECLNSSVVSNEISMLRRAYPYCKYAKNLDDLLVAKIPSYEYSSNRLVFAQSVLREQGEFPKVREYFEFVTNTLMHITQPLPQIELP